MAVWQEPSSVTTAVPLESARRRDRSVLQYSVVFLISFVILFLGMTRAAEIYDEGLILVGAMRVAAGQIPHRDFYANYGPGQFYTLALLFHWFGRSIFVERMYDLTLRAASVTVVYAIMKGYCRRWIAVSTTVVCGFWLFSSGLPIIGTPIIPILLISLVGSMVLLPVFQRDVAWQRLVSAGMLAGLVALFRYDVGAAFALVLTCCIAIAALFRRRLGTARLHAAISMLLPYWLGIAVVLLPVALLYLAVAPVHPFIHDILLYPSKYYVRARHLPFPRIQWRWLERIALYLPLPVVGLSLYSLFADEHRRVKPDTEELQKDEGQRGVLILFGLLTFFFYFKGLVRISIAQMLLALVSMALTLAVLYEYSSHRGRWLHRMVECAIGLSIFAATWSALKELRALDLGQDSVLHEALSRGSSVRWEKDACAAPPLHTGLCFLVDPTQAQVISYISEHTRPSERIFVGLTHHDTIAINDMLTYFVTNRLPATRWSHFDPDLQSREDIQTEMIQELDSGAVRYIVLESQFERSGEPGNDSSKSSGVTLLDDYISSHYHQVERFGTSSIWLRHGAPG
jgi:hypothetical protein